MIIFGTRHIDCSLASNNRIIFIMQRGLDTVCGFSCSDFLQVKTLKTLHTGPIWPCVLTVLMVALQQTSKL